MRAPEESGRRLVAGVLAALTLATISLASCVGDPTGEDAPTFTIALSDDELRPIYSTWIGQLGLVRDDPDIWRVRLSEACSLGVWDADVATRLAERYVVEDEPLSQRGSDAGPVSIEDAADSLWLMALDVCRSEFPPGAVDDGPPSMAGGA